MSFSSEMLNLLKVLVGVPAAVLAVFLGLGVLSLVVLLVLHLVVQLLRLALYCAWLVYFPLVGVARDADGEYDPDMFFISDIVGVALDALFLYIPVVNEDIKCLVLDNTLKMVVIILRSLSDLRFLPRICHTIRAGFRDRSRKQQIAIRLAIEIVAVLPLPQVRKRSKPAF